MIRDIMAEKSNATMVDKIIQEVTGWIKSGKYAVGAKLPSERELAKTFGLNLLTVNKAMAMLANAGIIVKGCGRQGSHVAKIPQKPSVVIICDIYHLIKSEHRTIDKLINDLIDSSLAHGFTPHFLLGRGSTVDDFMESLGIGSSLWNEVKGVISIGWKDGMDERFDALSLPLVVVAGHSRHYVSYDYALFGRMAAREVLHNDNPKKICMVHNLAFAPDDPSSPVYAFKNELELAGCQAKIVLIAAEECTCANGKHWAEYLRDELKTFDALVITNDNLAEGFAHVLSDPTAPNIPKTIVTHSNYGLIPDMPPHFKRIFFNQQDIAGEAFSMLSDLIDDKLPSTQTKSLRIKPFIVEPANSNPIHKN